MADDLRICCNGEISVETVKEISSVTETDVLDNRLWKCDNAWSFQLGPIIFDYYQNVSINLFSYGNMEWACLISFYSPCQWWAVQRSLSFLFLNHFVTFNKCKECFTYAGDQVYWTYDNGNFLVNRKLESYFKDGPSFECETKFIDFPIM